MSVMGKKKNARPGGATNTPSEAAEAPSLDYPFRFKDHALRAAVEAFASRDNRSINNAMNTLIRDALRSQGLWPPPESVASPQEHSA